MKVFLAFSGSYEERGCIGVFLTRESAVSAIRNDEMWLREEREREFLNKSRAGKGYRLHEQHFDLEEHEVKD